MGAADPFRLDLSATLVARMIGAFRLGLPRLVSGNKTCLCRTGGSLCGCWRALRDAKAVAVHIQWYLEDAIAGPDHSLSPGGARALHLRTATASVHRLPFVTDS